MSKRSRIVRRRMRAHENVKRWIDSWPTPVMLPMGTPVVRYTKATYETIASMLTGQPVYDHQIPDREVDPIVGKILFTATDTGPDGEAVLTCELVFKPGTTREQVVDYATVTGLTFTPTDRHRTFIESDAPPFHADKR